MSPLSVHRRAFLHLAGSAAVAGLSGCSPPAAPSRLPSAPAPHSELEETDVATLAAKMRKGELTAQELVRGYTARIEALDRAGPTLRSVIELNPDALSIAAALDEERRTKGARGPLHGIPVLIKDNIDTGDRMQTTAGSLALVGSPAREDAHVVARLRAAGAVIFGKTNLSEWANIRASKATSGWSGRGGLTKNPYVLDRNPAGSSSGSAVAVAASLCAIAVGTETVGSIISPSSICGVVGIKPTHGLVSRSGIVPIAHSLDTAGAIARTVADAAAVLGVLAGTDPRDATTIHAKPERDYVALLERGMVRGARLGVIRRPWATGRVGETFDAALEDLRRLGAVIVEPVELDAGPKLFDALKEVMLHELRVDLAAYLAARHVRDVTSLDDVIRFNSAHAAEELRWFGQDMFEKAATKGGLDAPEYVTALATCRRLTREEGIDAAIAGSNLDALVAPSSGPAWVTDLVNGDNSSGGSAVFAAAAGYPSITVPSGAVHELPLGICFFAGAFQEVRLLQIAHAYEQASKRRRPPRCLPTLVA